MLVLLLAGMIVSVRFYYAMGMIVSVRFYYAMNGQVYAYSDEEHRTNMAEPFFKGIHFLCQIANAYRAVTYQPRDEHDRQTCAKSENKRHEPVPSARQSKRYVNHREEIDQTMRAKGDGEENTQYERPKPTGVRVCILQKLADTMVVLVVMVSAEKQYNPANQHKSCQDRFSPMRKNMLNTFCLRAH